MGNPTSKVENSQNVLAQAQVNLAGLQTMQSQLNYFTIAVVVLLCVVGIIITYCVINKCKERIDRGIIRRLTRIIGQQKAQDGAPANIIIS